MLMRGRSGNPFHGDHKHTHTDFPDNRIAYLLGGRNVENLLCFRERIGSIRVVLRDRLGRLVLGGRKLILGWDLAIGLTLSLLLCFFVEIIQGIPFHYFCIFLDTYQLVSEHSILGVMVLM